MKGRKPKTAAAKAFSGNAGQRRIPDEPKATGRPRMPSYLDSLAKAEWRRIVPALLEMGIELGSVDTAVLANYCTAYSQTIYATQELVKWGSIFVDEKGNDRPRPCVAILAESRQAMLKFADVLGLTPVARARMGLARATGDKASKLDEFIRAGVAGRIG